MSSVAVISPHLDDAALALGELLGDHPHTVVVTVFAGSPAQYPPLEQRPHDDRCGFTRDDDVAELRRLEDLEALRQVAAVPVHLPFSESQYLEQHDPAELRAAVRAALETVDPLRIFVPVGLGHPDHVAASDAGIAVAEELRLEWFAYEEPGYRSAFPTELARRCNELRLTNRRIRRVFAYRKGPLVRAYRSQLLGLSALAMLDALEFEAMWGRR